MKRLLFIFGFAAVLAHALMSMVAGSLDPSAWSGLEVGVCILIVAPCIALAIAVIEGMCEPSPQTFSRRDRKPRRER